jgi:Glutathione S-transferase, N-terminal domain
VKLYVCWGTFQLPGESGHPCAHAYRALRLAGYKPQVIRSYGMASLPGLLNQTRGRRAVKRLTGTNVVPVLVTDSGEVIQESDDIVTWANTHPAQKQGTSLTR